MLFSQAFPALFDAFDHFLHLLLADFLLLVTSLSSSPRQYLAHVVLLLRGVEFSILRVFVHALLSLFQVKSLAVFDELIIFLQLLLVLIERMDVLDVLVEVI